MSKIIIYHGSQMIIKRPEPQKGKPYNDYGRGFYCTEHSELAKEWACTQGEWGYANKYQIEMDGLKVLNLSSGKYTVLHWLALLMDNRRVRISTPVMRQGSQWLKENFLINIEPYDAVIGYRADDSYFSFAKAFVNNQISLEQLSYAMRLGKLGEQIMIKSNEAFERVEFLSYEVADNSIYYPKRKERDEQARAAYQAELDRSGVEGLYMRDIIKEGVKADDSRLR